MVVRRHVRNTSFTVRSDGMLRVRVDRLEGICT